MDFPDYISFGHVRGMSRAIGKFLRVTGVGPVFVGKYGELEGKATVTLSLEQIHKVENKILKFDLLSFNGIKSYMPTNENGQSPYNIGDLLAINSTSVSKAFGTDLFGTATINHRHLCKATAEEVEETPLKSSNMKVSPEFLKIAEENNKVYKYNTVRRYLEDPYLRQKYKNQLEDIDQVYKGPGAQYKWKDLEAEFGNK